MSGADELEAGRYVGEGGEVLVGKLVSTSLGAVWLTFVAGWTAVVTAIVRIHIQGLNSAANAYVAIVRAAGVGGAQTVRVGWSAAFKSAVQVNPVVAPLILTLEIVVVSAIAISVRRRLMT